MKKIAVLTSGGDAPGMNATVRAVVRTAIFNGIEAYGIFQGYKGMLEGKIKKLECGDVGNIINRGGTFLGSARFPEFANPDVRKGAIQNLKNLGIDGLVVVGGDGSYRGAMALSREMDIKTIGIPGTIDNDICGTDFTIGFDTALNTIIDAIDKIRDTASSHERVFVIEVMGRNAGDLALVAGIAGGSESIIIPEKKESLEDVISRVRQAEARGKKHSIIILAEGVMSAPELSEMIKKDYGINVKYAILGHIQRGGTPSAMDRLLASRLGNYAVQLLIAGESGRAVGIQNNRLVSSRFEDVFEDEHTVDLDMYEVSKQLSI
ncbi:6-phosphofructokinase [Gemella sp. zg-1178]|uniref:6-phosphofructokinase n=1 Tax=Gemella sp. zg-1178 TaxID=2840372 RepID=UPI001C048754|nr:6-phosphofructokinase [Gemella sp. zg-1178]MBU0278571.1 6-phosphofructokinase [Gemella sp. zg-1178]